MLTPERQLELDAEFRSNVYELLSHKGDGTPAERSLIAGSLVDWYTEQTIVRPPARLLERLADYILGNDDPTILTESQLLRRVGREPTFAQLSD